MENTGTKKGTECEMVAKAWDSGIEEVGSGGSRVRGQPWLALSQRGKG